MIRHKVEFMIDIREKDKTFKRKKGSGKPAKITTKLMVSKLRAYFNHKSGQHVYLGEYQHCINTNILNTNIEGSPLLNKNFFMIKLILCHFLFYTRYKWVQFFLVKDRLISKNVAYPRKTKKEAVFPELKRRSFSVLSMIQTAAESSGVSPFSLIFGMSYDGLIERLLTSPSDKQVHELLTKCNEKN
ncbi:hypothetical protein BpHYR1_011008 [Brachionus plicatilis]|uniref:Uncharacterized protein n=1 Tax=Brachionus plicatilis TaxID=10195 RepID=A0A3M7PRR7_BRAPC|nr:hypothetical protein BpHYR1_011008 [Brachionus plicatilis]